MKDYKIRYTWNNKIFAEPVMGKDFNDAVLNFIEQIHKDTKLEERLRAGFKLMCEDESPINYEILHC